MKVALEAALLTASRVLEAEALAIRDLIPRLGEPFIRALDILAGCAGKIAVTGMGKSGIVCKKLAATFSSTGTPAIFLHAAEALHGDLGLLSRNDVLLVISKSGETDEILQLIDVVKRLRLKLISLSGNPRSTLARHSDVNLDVSVSREACPLGLAPTTSTAAALAMGDALAMALMERKGLRVEDFAWVHPAGSLGKRLLKVEDLMHKGDEIPRVLEETPMAEVIYEMSKKGLGITTVVSERERLRGVISDGDLRRLLQKHHEPLGMTAGQCMTLSPKTISPGDLATTALSRMEQLRITSLIVVDDSLIVRGLIHIHDLWRVQLF